jgi:hypothetical protein
MIRRSNRPLLFVEGKTEQRLLPYLLEANGIRWPKEDPPVFIKEMDGFENFWTDRVIHTELKAAALAAVGLIFDADEPEDGRWETVARYCRSFAPDLPNEPRVDGWITESTIEGGPRFGVWMMPNNQSRGYLETFLEVLVPDHELWSYADEVVTGALERGARFNAKRHRDKAKIHSWLAWQEEPGKQLHEAVAHRALEPTSPHAAPFVDWFRRLFP